MRAKFFAELEDPPGWRTMDAFLRKYHQLGGDSFEACKRGI